MGHDIRVDPGQIHFKALTVMSSVVFVPEQNVLPQYIQFRGVHVDGHGRKNYHTFRIWGKKANTLRPLVTKGAVIELVAEPRSYMMDILGKGHKPLKYNDGSGKVRKMSYTFFTVVSVVA